MPTVGLSMIVKNESHTLAACLTSVQGLVSQIVVADTGSTDETVAIAQRFGATVLHIPWENDFAKARNAALKPMVTDWVLELDADEELDREATAYIPGLTEAKGVGGYLTPIRNYLPTRFGRAWDRVAVENDGRHPRAKDAPGYVVHENCRLFRRHPKIYFKGRVHELVEHSIRELGMKLPIAPFCIHHFGRLTSEEARQRKAEFYMELLRTKVAENPNDAIAQLELGLQEIEFFHDPEKALACFRRALAINSRLSQAWLFTGMAELRLGHLNEALAALQRANSDGVGAGFKHHWMGDALLGLGRAEEAKSSYRRALRLSGDDPILESKLGLLEVKLEKRESGIDRLRRAAKAMPGNFDICDALVKAYIIADRLPDAALEAEQCAMRSPQPKLFLRAASIYSKLGDNKSAGGIISRGLESFPDSPELLQASGELAERRRRNALLAT